MVLCDRAEVAFGSTGRAMGGVRQQFSTAAEVRLTQESIRFFEELGPPFFLQVGYVFLARTEGGFRRLEERLALQRSLGVPAEHARVPDGIRADDVVGAVACWTDGVADPPGVTQELVRRAAGLGVRVQEGVDARELDRDVLVICCGPHSPELAPELPIRPLCRQLLETEPRDVPDDLPMVVEEETGFHFRSRGGRLRIAMTDEQPRWGFGIDVDESVFEDRLARLARRFPAHAGARVERAWAGLYDMTPDAHPIIGRIAEGVYAACGFSGHGFMQSPAVGRAVAAEILGRESPFDLSPYRLERFADGAVFPELLVL